MEGAIRWEDDSVIAALRAGNADAFAGIVDLLRLQNIRYALMQRGWRPEGRPVRFFPPQ